MDETRELAHEQGYVETLLGRRLYLPEINSRNAQRRQYAERTAINAPMQGTAADIIKQAMGSIDAWLTDSQTNKQTSTRMIIQVHDELVFECHQDQLETDRAKIVEYMVSAAELDVPLEVDANTGENWDQAH
jgi:DNA polymerase-1